jgi:hypothetical protein
MPEENQLSKKQNLRSSRQAKHHTLFIRFYLVDQKSDDENIDVS